MFKDCDDCPEMVAIPAGRFVMGVAPGEEERDRLVVSYQNLSSPQHRVSVASFSAGKYEVTKGQYHAFQRATDRSSEGCSVWTGSNVLAWRYDLSKDWRNPGYSQDDQHPVVCVSWNDARAYVAWLSQKTGKSYRLLTEAEWEYAARAGTTTSRFWGDDEKMSCTYANGFDLDANAAIVMRERLVGIGGRVFCSDRYVYTAPAGSYRANAFGLYDMLGNVREWTEDCWNSNYHDAPVDGSAWTARDCLMRVMRGGSWKGSPQDLRSAMRLPNNPAIQADDLGFRVATTY